MSRDWSDLFISDAQPLPVAQESFEVQESQSSGSFFGKLRENLRMTREALSVELEQTLFDTLDDETWERLEESLIMADCGAQATAKIVTELETMATVQGISDPEALRNKLVELLIQESTPDGEPQIDLRHKPTVIMVCGVNGTGKTTTIGKLANVLTAQLGLKVVMGAADTFRAAAVEQLQVWGERTGSTVIAGKSQSDPSAVAYEAVNEGVRSGADIVIVDTAGRLHTQQPLMDELSKVRRVISKLVEGAPHETLLTIDATTGQNGVRQAREFSAATPVDGIVLTKLDGSAKGGVAVAIAQELSVPVKIVGVGEGLGDLQPFDPADFARALVGS